MNPYYFPGVVLFTVTATMLTGFVMYRMMMP